MSLNMEKFPNVNRNAIQEINQKEIFFITSELINDYEKMR